MKRTRPFLILLICAALVYLMVACAPDAPERVNDAGNADSRGKEAAPDFELASLKDIPIKLSSYRGKIVVLNFWATWCPPCRHEIPDFIEAQNRYRAQGVEFIGVSLDEQGKSVVAPFVQQNGINYTILIGTEQVVNNYGGINAIPTTFFIDREGKVVRQVEGAMEGKMLDQILSSIITISK